MSKTDKKSIKCSFFINFSRDGEFGNSMLILAKIKDSKRDNLFENSDEITDITFVTRENFDESLLYTFKKEKNNAFFSTSSLIQGETYVDIVAIPPSVWDLEKTEQVKKLKIIKDSLIAEMLGRRILVSDLTKLSILLKRPYSLTDAEKIYFKKISSELYLSSEVNC